MNVRILSRQLVVILLILMLSACGPAAPLATPTAGAPATAPALQSAPTQTPVTAVPGYPAPLPTAPTSPTRPADYPAPPTIPPPADPYPGGLVWIVRPVGVQCEEGTAPGYGDLREATATMTAAGVRVKESQMTEMMVTAVCGSPTSAHFRLQIDANDLQTAELLGWTSES